MGKKQKSLKKNFIMNIVLTMSSFIFPLITFPYVSRILLPEGTGRVSFATSLISYFTLFSQMGIPTYGISICAKARDDKEKLSRTAHELLILNLVMCVLAYIFLGLALLFVPRLFEDRLLYVIVSSSILLTAIGMEWLYKALEQYTYITIRSIIFKFVALIAMFLLVHEQKDYVIYGGISILAASASNIFNLINVHKYIIIKPIKNYDFKRHLKPIGIFFAMACATTIYTHLDTLMLGFMTTNVDVGYYNAAIKIKNILLSIITSLGAVLLPRASYYVENNQMDEFRKISSKALNFVFILASPLFLYFTFFAKEGIFFLSGMAYQGSIAPMQILMPTLLLIGITNIWGIQMLIPLGKAKVVLYSEIVGAVVDVILNALLIPSLGASGAAIGTLVAEFSVLAVQFCYLKDKVSFALKEIRYWKIGLGLLVGSVACLWIKLLHFGYFLSLFFSALLFFGAYGLVLLILKEKLVMEIFNIVLTSLKRMKKNNG